MHYYKRNLGDYAKKAGRLSMLQHGAYTLLMDSCYDREQFPTLEEAIDWTWADSKEEIEAVEFVLKKFFVLEGDVYVQPRIKEEIGEYQAKAETNKRIALEREAKRREKPTNRSASSTVRARGVGEPPQPEHETPPNQEPLTINQEKNKDSSSEAVASDPGGGGGGHDPDETPKQEKFSADDYLFAEGMFRSVQRVAPKTKPPNMERWADTIRLMRERDGLTLAEMAAVFRFANRDDFWKTNILSPAKLREQFAKLDAKMRNPAHEKRITTSADRWTIDHDDTSWLTGASGSSDCIDGELDLPPDADDLHRLEAGRRGRH